MLAGSLGGSYTATGNASAIVGTTGNDTISATGGSDTIVGGTGNNLLSASGTGNVIIGGGTDTISATGLNDTVIGSGSTNLTFVGGASTVTIIGGSGTNSVTPGSGGVVFESGSGTATVNAGAGPATLFGSSGANMNLVNGNGTGSAPNYAVGGSGSETLNASNSTGAVWLSVNSSVTSSSATMIAGSGNDTLIAGVAGGSTTMTGGSGADAFVFFKQAAGGAHDVINNFTASDSVYIEGYGPGSAGLLQATSSVGAGGLTLTLSDGTSVTFSNLTSASSLNGKIQYG
jgi:Ca2+-binding RTX toxin-like protein